MQKFTKAKGIIAAATISATALLGLAMAPDAAEAATARTTRLEPPVRHVKHVRVTYVAKARANRVWVEFNTGSLWSVVPCRYEDSNNCYWDASKRGNRKGRDFVTIGGKTYRLTI